MIVTARPIRTLLEDRRGTSVLELGLILPLIMTVLVGLVDVARTYSRQMALQQAAIRSLERVQAGQERGNFAYVQLEATAAATEAHFTAPLVTVSYWLECNGARVTIYNSLCLETQTTARYVQVTITASHSPHFSFSPVGVRQANGTVALSASHAVRVG